VVAGTPRLGLASLDLDHPLGRQARGAGVDQEVDDLPVTEPAQLRVRKAEASELAAD
jgi:hypothetical protein